MIEYVSKEEACKESFTVQTKEYGSIEVVPVDYIASLPKANVQLIKQGKWLKERIRDEKSLLNGAIKNITCSVCGKDGHGYFCYCPNCGAQMIGTIEK